MEWIDSQAVWSRVMGSQTNQGMTDLRTETASAYQHYTHLAKVCTATDQRALRQLAKVEAGQLSTLHALCYFVQGTCPAQIFPVLEEETCLTQALRNRYLSAQGRRSKLLQLAKGYPALEPRLLHMAEEQSWCCDTLLTLTERRLLG